MLGKPISNGLADVEKDMKMAKLHDV